MAMATSSPARPRPAPSNYVAATAGGSSRQPITSGLRLRLRVHAGGGGRHDRRWLPRSDGPAERQGDADLSWARSLGPRHRATRPTEPSDRQFSSGSGDGTATARRTPCIRSATSSRCFAGNGPGGLTRGRTLLPINLSKYDWVGGIRNLSGTGHPALDRSHSDDGRPVDDRRDFHQVRQAEVPWRGLRGLRPDRLIPDGRRARPSKVASRRSGSVCWHPAEVQPGPTSRGVRPPRRS